METRGAVVLASDIDRMLIAYDEDPPEMQEEANQALHVLHDTIAYLKQEAPFDFFFGTSTGRNPASHQEAEDRNQAFARLMSQANFKNTSVGTRVLLREPHGTFTSLQDWPLVETWDHDLIAATLSERPELDIQDKSAQDTYKVSFDVQGVSDHDTERYVSSVQHHLGSIGIAADAIFSAGLYLDIVPPGVNKGSSLHHTMGHLAITHDLDTIFSIAAGDSMNDTELLAAANVAVLPANAYPSLHTWANSNISERLYRAQTSFGASILDCFKHLHIIT